MARSANAESDMTSSGNDDSEQSERVTQPRGKN